MNCKAGEPAFIVRPWAIDADIGRPVNVLRAAYVGEVTYTRSGGRCRVAPGYGAVWLCDAPCGTFPCFIADECLRPFHGDVSPEEVERLYEAPQDQRDPCLMDDINYG